MPARSYIDLVLKNIFQQALTGKRDQFMSFPIDGYTSMYFGLPVYNIKHSKHDSGRKNLKPSSALQVNLGKTGMEKLLN